MIRAIEIKWDYSTEVVPVVELNGQHPPKNITTTERWEKVKGKPAVSYVANFEDLSRENEHNTLHLRYHPDDQKDQLVTDPKYEVRWGVCVIRWNNSRKNASAEWFDDEDKTYDGPAVEVTALGGESPFTKLRKSASVIVKTRPGQPALRNRLLLLDKYCSITGEKEAASLEAAHIIPVKARGCEVIANAILMRADLHRLFDAGLFWFDASGDEGAISHSQSLSENYKKILTGAKLPEAQFDRVKLALRARAELKDGKGPCG